MKQSCILVKLPMVITILLSFLVVDIYAQERKSLTMPFEGGTLTFQYYEKDGVKVPDGPMEFIKKNYTEKGECKDGYREGLWEVSPGKNAHAEYHYKNGMLEGVTTFTNSSSEKYSLNLFPNATYNFSKGRLFGKNKIINHSDTIYCNFGDKGQRIGVWKIVKPEKTIILEYDDESEIKDSYELDVLGQKKPVSVIPSITMALLGLDRYFKELPFELRDKKRPKLPTLCENKYGYIGPLEAEQD